MTNNMFAADYRGLSAFICEPFLSLTICCIKNLSNLWSHWSDWCRTGTCTALQQQHCTTQ